MKQLKVRFSTPEDSKQIVEWLNLTPNNLFDPDILKYPTLKTLCSYGDDGAVCYQPVQQVLVLESRALKPGLDSTTSSMAIRDLTHAAELLASSLGIKELMFVGNDESVNRIAQKNAGFEVLPWKTLRLKL